MAFEWDSPALWRSNVRAAVFDSVITFLDRQIFNVAELPFWPAETIFTHEHTIRAILAIFFVCLICGAMGALVVGNRMAFFSDALAHCAFAGVALGILLTLFIGGPGGQIKHTGRGPR